MEIMTLILIGIIIILLLGLVTVFIFLYKKKEVGVIEPPKTQELSSELSISQTVLKENIDDIKSQLTLQKEELQNLISSFKKETIDNNISYIKNISTLQQKVEEFQSSVNKQDNNLKVDLHQQKSELQNLINEFKKETVDTNMFFNSNISKLNQQIDEFKTSVQKQDSDLKTDLNQQKVSLDAKITTVFNDLTLLKKSTETLDDVSLKVKSLNDIFLNSKKTGNLGEWVLKKILSDIFGENQNIWSEQHQLANNGIVDAYVKTESDKEGIAIDSKFSLINYNNYIDAEKQDIKARYLNAFKQDLKNRVNEVEKYINPENNISNAIMFIPSEIIFSFIYAEFQNEVIAYAFKKKVWITSPTTLSALLFIIEKHSRDVGFNKNIKKIHKNFMELKDEFDRWVTRWSIVVKEINKTNKAITDLDTTHKKIANRYKEIEKPLISDIKNKDIIEHNILIEQSLENLSEINEIN